VLKKQRASLCLTPKMSSVKRPRGRVSESLNEWEEEGFFGLKG